MVMVAASGLVLTWVRSQGSLSYALIVVSHSIIGWGLSLITALAMARCFGPVVRRTAVRATCSTLLTFVLFALGYLVWAHYRTMYEFVNGLDHGFPYPDLVINNLAKWFDARYPARPGSLKLHGEYPRVGFVLGIFVLVFSSASGWFIGVLSRGPASSRSS
jgi:hypothetical protein